MLRPRERWIFMCRFQPRVQTDRVEPPRAYDFMLAIQAVVNAGHAFEDDIVEGTTEPYKRLSIKGMELSEKETTILFAIGDCGLSDPVFDHLPTGKQRVAKKAAGEGVSFACHMMISLEPDTNGSYPLALENVPYLSRGTLEPFMKRLVKNSGYEFAEIDANGKSIVVRPNFSIDGDLSQRLKDELENGAIEGIVLVRQTKFGQGLDEAGYFRETSMQIKLKADENADPFSVIAKLRARAKKMNMDIVKVRYVREDEKIRTINYPANQAYDPRDALNVRCELLEFKHDLPNSRTQIDKNVQKQMRKLLNGG